MTTKEVIFNEQLGDLDEFAEKHKRLIHSVCQRYYGILQRYNLDYDDLFQIGFIGLMKAYKNFDGEKYNVKISTYAVPMIAGEIQRFLRDGYGPGGMRVPRPTYELSKKIRKDNNTSKTVVEISEIYECSESMASKALELQSLYIESTSSAAYSGKDGDDVTFEDKMGEDEDRTSIFVKEFIQYLPPKLKKITVMKYEKNARQEEIAKEIGVSQVQVSRLINEKIKPALEKYLNGEDISGMEDVNIKKQKPKDKPKRREGAPSLGEKSIRELVLEGKSNKEIVELTGCQLGSIYQTRSQLKKGKLKSDEKKKEVEQKSIVTVAKKLTEEEIQDFKKTLEETKGGTILTTKPEPNYELAAKMFENDLTLPPSDVAKATNMSNKQASDVKHRIKKRLNKVSTSKPDISFKLQASNNGATKNQAMKDFAKLMETVTNLNVDDISYYITIEAPSK
jgi:RNA polymerase sigma factor (sigma-70 family)